MLNTLLYKILAGYTVSKCTVILDDWPNGGDRASLWHVGLGL